MLQFAVVVVVIEMVYVFAANFNLIAKLRYFLMVPFSSLFCGVNYVHFGAKWECILRNRERKWCCSIELRIKLCIVYIVSKFVCTENDSEPTLIYLQSWIVMNFFFKQFHHFQKNVPSITEKRIKCLKKNLQTTSRYGFV